MATWDEERLKVENEVMGAMVDFLRANGIPYKSDIGYLEFPRPMVPEDKFKKIVEKAEAKLKELGYENYNVFETTIIVDFPEQIKWYKATFSSRTGGAQMWRQAGSGEEREWYVYLPASRLVLSGYATSLEAQKEATRVERELGQHVMVLPRGDKRILEYARTHPAWAKREGFPGPEVREGDVGVLTESMMADDTAGYSHRIPEGMEVKVARVEPKFIGFHTGDVIEGENYFITPLTLEFRRKFRKRSEGERVDEVAIRILELLKEKGPMTEYEISTELGVPPERVGETTDILMGESKIERETPTGLYKLPPLTRHDCPVCGDPVAGGPEEYLEHIKTKHPEEWRKLETDPSYTLRRGRLRKPDSVEKTREALPW